MLKAQESKSIEVERMQLLAISLNFKEMKQSIRMKFGLLNWLMALLILVMERKQCQNLMLLLLDFQFCLLQYPKALKKRKGGLVYWD